jgi:hypothetical protein
VVGHQHGGHGAGDAPAQVEDADAAQYSSHCSSLDG